MERNLEKIKIKENKFSSAMNYFLSLNPSLIADNDDTPTIIQDNVAELHDRNPIYNRRKDGKLRSGTYKTIKTALKNNPSLERVAKIFFTHIPQVPLVSYTLKSDRPTSFREPIYQAVNAPWISPNNDIFTNAIVIDVDHDNYQRLLDLIAEGVPAPLCSAINPRNGHYHAVWFLRQPVNRNRGGKAVKLLNVTRDLLRVALDGDARMTNQLMKNPFGVYSQDDRRPTPQTISEQALAESGNLAWVTHDNGGDLVDLKTLADSLSRYNAELQIEYEANPPARFGRRRPISAEDNPEGRNCTVFDKTRNFAYSGCVKDYSTLYEMASSFNDAPKPLPKCEIRSIAKSIHWFMNHKYTGKGRSEDKNYGVLGLYGSDMPLPQKQRLGALYSAEQKSTKTTDKILSAALRFKKQKRKNPTQLELAGFAGVGKNTVCRRWKEIIDHLSKYPLGVTSEDTICIDGKGWWVGIKNTAQDLRNKQNQTYSAPNIRTLLRNQDIFSENTTYHETNIIHILRHQDPPIGKIRPPTPAFLTKHMEELKAG